MSEQTELLQQELQRISDLSNNLYSNFDVESRSYEYFQLLACVVCHLHPSYFWRPISERQSVSKLLAGKKEAVQDLYEFVASSTMKNILKCHLLGDAWGFLKSAGYSEKELAHLDEIFNVRRSMEDFWQEDSIFAGLE